MWNVIINSYKQVPEAITVVNTTSGWVGASPRIDAELLHSPEPSYSYSGDLPKAKQASEGNWEFENFCRTKRDLFLSKLKTFLAGRANCAYASNFIEIQNLIDDSMLDEAKAIASDCRALKQFSNKHIAELKQISCDCFQGPVLKAVINSRDAFDAYVRELLTLARANKFISDLRLAEFLLPLYYANKFSQDPEDLDLCFGVQAPISLKHLEAMAVIDYESNSHGRRAEILDSALGLATAGLSAVRPRFQITSNLVKRLSSDKQIDSLARFLRAGLIKSGESAVNDFYFLAGFDSVALQLDLKPQDILRAFNDNQQLCTLLERIHGLAKSRNSLESN